MRMERRMGHRRRTVGIRRAVRGLAGSAAASATTAKSTRGYVVDERSLEQVKAGATAEKVLALLGTPSTTSTVGGTPGTTSARRWSTRCRSCRPKMTDQRVWRSTSTRQEGRAHRQLRPAGRQGVRLHQPHDADRRRRAGLPQEHHGRLVQVHLRSALPPDRVWYLVDGANCCCQPAAVVTARLDGQPNR